MYEELPAGGGVNTSRRFEPIRRSISQGPLHATAIEQPRVALSEFTPCKDFL